MNLVKCLYGLFSCESTRGQSKGRCCALYLQVVRTFKQTTHVRTDDIKIGDHIALSIQSLEIFVNSDTA